MSVIAELQKIAQDVIAPEIRANTHAIGDLKETLAAIRADIVASEQRTASRTEASEKRAVEITEASEKRAIERNEASEKRAIERIEVSEKRAVERTEASETRLLEAVHAAKTELMLKLENTLLTAKNEQLTKELDRLGTQ